MALTTRDREAMILTRVHTSGDASLPTHVYDFVAPCCDTAALHVTYVPGDKVLFLNCAECDLTLAEIAVAATP